jgi:hypothetical protein
MLNICIYFNKNKITVINVTLLKIIVVILKKNYLY